MFKRSTVPSLKKVSLKVDKKNPRSIVFLGKRVLVPTAIALLVILLVEVWAVNRLSSYGDKLTQIKNSQETLTLENQVLENQVAQKSSLFFIEQSSFKLGFESAKNIEYLKTTAVASAQ